MKAASKYLRNGGVATFTCGKIAYLNPNRKVNYTEIEFGFRMLSGNKEPYFSLSGSIWNGSRTGILVCGVSVPEDIYKYCPSPLLKEMIDLASKYHLMNKSHIPTNVVKRIESIVEIMTKAVDDNN